MGLAPIRMPQLGESVTEGTVDRWLKKEGDMVTKDEPLVEVVTDKVNAEIPSPYAGRLVRISVAEGATIEVGTEIAQIEVEGLAGAGAEPSAPKATTAAPHSEAPSALAPQAAAETAGPATPPGDPGNQRFSPAVRKLAQEHGIDPRQVPGTGLGGRVTREDLLAFIDGGGSTAAAQPAAASETPASPVSPASPPTTPPAAVPAAAQASTPVRPVQVGEREELVKLGAVRRQLADHMVKSLAVAPHVWTMVEVDVTPLVRYRETEKEAFRQRHGFGLTYLPFVASVLADALREFPYLNSSWTNEGIVLKKYVNLGIAVAIPPDGLMVPVIRDADQMGLTDIARAINSIAERARTKSLRPDDVSGGTFTLNNTGATGSVQSMPIINQPQAAILTTEIIQKRPMVVGDGIAVRSMMNMCLSFDHRILDGYMAGQFTTWIKKRLEGWTPANIKL